MSIINKVRGIAAVSLFSFSALSHAAIIHLAGNTVDFYYDDSQPGMSIYGPLSAVGDSIFAQSVNFSAIATNGSSASINPIGSITIVARSGYSFNSMQVAQIGDYQLNGANAAVNVSGQLIVTDTATSLITENNNLLVSGLGLNDNLRHQWQASAGFDLSTAIWSNVSSIDLSLNSLLTASTLSNTESAFVESNFVGGGMVTIETTVVPVPAAVWLFGSGLLALVGFARRSTAIR